MSRGWLVSLRALFYSGASWVWWPGPVAATDADLDMVAATIDRSGSGVRFILGFGGGVGVGVGFGSFGWLPIGPCDSFRPWYGGRYGGRFNQVNITNIYNNGGPCDRFRDEGFRGERPLYQGRADSIPTFGWLEPIRTFAERSRRCRQSTSAADVSRPEESIWFVP